MKKTLAIAAITALISFAAVADTTPPGQVLFGPGQGVTLTGAQPPTTSAGAVVVDTVTTKTAGDLLDVNNGGTTKAKIDFAGTLTAIAFTSSGAVTFTTTAPASVATTGTAASAALTANGQAGGASATGATNNTGGAGSPDSIKSGAGGVASGAATGTNTGGAGGTMTFGTGAGAAASGATTASTGGAGGAASYAAGIGGAATGTATTNTGGAGGASTVSSGTGGAASGGTTNNGGAGGALSVTAGTGGNGTQTGGAGGSVAIASGSAGTGGNAAAGNITITPGAATGSGKAGSVTIGGAVAANGAGVRIKASRIIFANWPTSPPACSGTLTVTQVLEAGLCTITGTATATFPTMQGSGGVVQALPGTPAVGDMFQYAVSNTHASQVVTFTAGAGQTLTKATSTPGANLTIFWCRITDVTAGAELVTCY